MNVQSPKFVPPSNRETAFSCPHCGAFTSQFWHELSPRRLGLGSTPAQEDHGRIAALFAAKAGQTTKAEGAASPIEPDSVDKTGFKNPIFQRTAYWQAEHRVDGIWLSSCFNCKQIAIWLRDCILWPKTAEITQPNPDLSADVKRDYLEAATILDSSPRGAAALLRLAIQKVCKDLGEKGTNINHDIGELVKRGLDRRVQQALDIVRVIGNEAVHPGQLDLRDDRATALNLFGLVNLIADIMISQPKHLQEMFDALPESKKKAIEERDGQL